MQPIALLMAVLKLAILSGWVYLVVLLARSLRPVKGPIYSFRLLAALLGVGAALHGTIHGIRGAALDGLLSDRIGHWPGWIWLEAPPVALMLVCTVLLLRLMLSKRHRVVDRALNEVRRLRSEVGQDPLTGLGNRATLNRRLAELAESNEPLSVLFIDVDHFKGYNDAYGHLAGDEVLRCLSALMLGAVRRSDLVARYGGEEFAILLPGAPLHVGRAIAEKLRQQAAEHQYPHRQVTLSIGAAASPADSTDPAALLMMADAAMYRAKGAGGNQVCHCGDLNPSAVSKTQEGESLN